MAAFAKLRVISPLPWATVGTDGDPMTSPVPGMILGGRVSVGAQLDASLGFDDRSLNGFDGSCSATQVVDRTAATRPVMCHRLITPLPSKEENVTDDWGCFIIS
jgi:hypothetical protein